MKEIKISQNLTKIMVFNSKNKMILQLKRKIKTMKIWNMMTKKFKNIYMKKGRILRKQKKLYKNIEKE